MAQQTDQQQLAKVFGSLMAAKDSGDQGPDPQIEYYKQREKFEKRRMVSSILAPIAGQFLGNLVAAPFREPVQDFLDTQKGRDLYGQWAAHDIERRKVEALTQQMENFDGSGIDYYRHINKQRMDTEYNNRFGEKWYEQPSMQAIAQNYNDHLDTIARKEYNEYLEAVDYYKLFPDQETFLENIERYGPRSSNLGQAVYRRIKRAVSGQSEEEYIEQAILNITGVNSHIFAQKMDDPLIGSDDVSMDVETFRERMARSVSPVSREEMFEYIREAQEQYMLTPYGQQRTFENQQQILNDASRRHVSAWRTSSLTGDAEGWSSIHEHSFNTFRNNNDGRLPTSDELNFEINKILGIELVDHKGEISNAFLNDDMFKFFRDGETIELDDGEQRYVTGFNESIFNKLFNNPERQENVPWNPEESLEGNLERASASNKFGTTARESFVNTRNNYLNHIISTAKDMQSILLANGMITDIDFLVGPGKEVEQKNMLLHLSERIARDFVERGDITIYENNLWSFDGTSPSITKRMLTGQVFSREAIASLLQDVENDSEIENDLQTLEGPDVPVAGTDVPGAGTDVPGAGIDVPGAGTGVPGAGAASEDEEEPFLDPSPLSQITQENRPPDYGNKIASELATILQGSGFALGSPEDVPIMLEYFNNFNEEQLNIPGTRAFNFMTLPFFNSLQQNSIDPIAIPGSDGLFMRISPQRRPHASTILNTIEESVDGKFLQIEIGRFESLSIEKPPEFVLGRGTLATEVEERASIEEEGMFVPLNSRASREALRNLEIPNEISTHLAVIANNSYIPLLKELDSLEVSINDMIPKTTFGGGRYMDSRTGEYKGDTPEEIRINQIKMALDIMQRSIGVPGIDKAGPRPIMHDLLLQSYMKHIGPTDDEERLLISRLSDADMSGLIAKGTEALLNTPLGPGSRTLLREAPEYFGSAAVEAGGSLLRAARDVDVGAGIERATEAVGEGAARAARTVTEAGRSLLEGARDRLDSVYFPGLGNRALAANVAFKESISKRPLEQRKGQDGSFSRLSSSQQQEAQDSRFLKDIRNYNFDRLNIKDNWTADTYLNLLNDAIILAESSGDFQAEHSEGASGGYQFKEESAKTAARRVINMSNRITGGKENPPQWVVDVAEGTLGILDLSPMRQRILFEGDMFEREGTDEVVSSILQGDIEALNTFYYDFHHTEPDLQSGTRSNWEKSVRNILNQYGL